MQSLKVISIRLIRMFAPIAVRVLMFARLKQFILHNHHVGEIILLLKQKPFHNGEAFFINIGEHKQASIVFDSYLRIRALYVTLFMRQGLTAKDTSPITNHCKHRMVQPWMN
jgi:hypothetical protein